MLFLCSENRPGEDRYVKPKKKPFFFSFLIQLFCSLAQELTVGVVTRLLLPTYCRASQELHHLASEDQLSGNTFAFAHVARTPFRLLPGFTGAEHDEVRRLSAPAPHGALCQDMHCLGDCIPWAPGSPKPSQILLQRVQIASALVLGGSTKAWVFSSSWLTPARSNPFCLLMFPLEFLLPLPACSELV